MAKSYRDLKVWVVAFELAQEVYGLAKQLPAEEKFGLCSQMQRSAVSIPSNIAEGQQRGSAKEFKQFLHIARGSAAELATQLQLSRAIYNLDTTPLVDKTESIQKMLYALISKL